MQRAVSMPKMKEQLLQSPRKSKDGAEATMHPAGSWTRRQETSSSSSLMGLRPRGALQGATRVLLQVT